MEEKKNELLERIESASTIEEVKELEKEVEELAKEEVVEEQPKDEEEQPKEVEEIVEEVVEDVVDEQPKEEEEKSCEDDKEEKENITTDEERALIRTSVECEKKNIKPMEERKMENEKIYRSAWAKKLMGKALNEEETRALGDAITTTATTFVESDAETQGINNAGLLIPSSFRADFLKLMEDESPIYRDARKLAVAGNVDMGYLFASDDANWYAESADTANEGAEFKSIQLTGYELAKDIVVTWKVEEMSVDGFIDFLMQELKVKMGEKLIDAIIYGNGSGKPTGVTYGLTPVEVEATDSVVDKIIKAYKSLDKDAKRGAKAYVSVDANLDIIGYKDENGNYPYLNGGAIVKGLGIEVDPFLKDDDIVVGNMMNYVIKETTPIRIDKEISVKGRKVVYGAYAIYDGKAKPNSFAFVTTPVSA